MKARLLIATLLGVALGGAAVTVSPLRSAPAPEAKTQRWEYKVIRFTATAMSDAADKLTDEVNALAKDGWEYAGPLAPPAPGTFTGQYVTFRRAKS